MSGNLEGVIPQTPTGMTGLDKGLVSHRITVTGWDGLVGRPYVVLFEKHRSRGSWFTGRVFEPLREVKD